MEENYQTGFCFVTGTGRCFCTKLTAFTKSCPVQSKQVPSCRHKRSKRSADDEKQENNPDRNEPEKKEMGEKNADQSIKELLCCIRTTDKSVYKSGRKKRTGNKAFRPHRRGK